MDLLRRQMERPAFDFEGGGVSIDMSGQDAARRKQLDAAEARLKTLQDRTPEQRQKDFEASERLRKSVDNLSETIKGQQQGATAQKSSAEGDGAFPGARIQTAAFTGGGGGFRRLPSLGGGANLPGGGSGPGYVGEAGPAGSGAGRNFGGGRFNGLGGGAPRVPSISGGSPRMPGIGSGGVAGNSGALGRGPTSAEGKENVASWLGFFQRPKDQGGMGLDRDKADAMVAMMQGESGVNLRSNHEYHDRNGPSGGVAAWHDVTGKPNGRLTQLKNFAGQMDRPWTDREVQQQFWKHEAETTERKAFRAVENARSGEEALAAGVSGFERPQFPGAETAKRMAFLNRLRRDRVQPLERPEASSGGSADGEAWAARERARKTFDAQQEQAQRMERAGSRLTASAARAGIVSGPNIENNGSVYVNVQKAGPDARVSTSASGNLFKDVVLRRGRAMEKAEGS